MRRKNVLRVYFLVCIVVVCAEVSVGQTRVGNMLNHRLEPLETQADTMHLMLSKISGDYSVPIGLEAATDGEGPILSVVIQGRNLRDVLDDIVKQDSRYEWRIVDDVINVRPRSRRDPLLEGILETRVRTFVIPKDMRLPRLRYELTEIPEIVTQLRKAEVSPGVFWIGASPKLGKDFSLSVTNVRFRDLLNQIIRTSDIKYWIVNRYGKHNEFFVLNF
jgi:hypothetical protein